MYNLIKSIERLVWRLKKDKNGKQKPFYPNENDIKALNTIISWVNRQKNETIKNNQLFAKLYIRELTLLARKYETFSIDEIPQKELSKILDMPLEWYYKAFERELYSAQITKICERFSRDNEPISQEDFKKIYNSEFIKGSLNHMATEALNRFS